MITCASHFRATREHLYVSSYNILCDLNQASDTKELTNVLHAICNNVTLPADLDCGVLIVMCVPADDRTDN